jgi:acyl-coenzyme A synthetase/AMP-(fatty) acid ligase
LCSPAGRLVVSSQLPTYQVPVEIRILDALPRNPSMKVSQGAVRQLFEAALT